MRTGRLPLLSPQCLPALAPCWGAHDGVPPLHACLRGRGGCLTRLTTCSRLHSHRFLLLSPSLASSRGPPVPPCLPSSSPASRSSPRRSKPAGRSTLSFSPSSPTVACWEASSSTNRSVPLSPPTAGLAVDPAVSDLAVPPRPLLRAQGETASLLSAARFSPSPSPASPPSGTVPTVAAVRRPRAPGRAPAWADPKAGRLGRVPGLAPSLGRPLGRMLRAAPRPAARPGRFGGRPAWEFLSLIRK